MKKITHQSQPMPVSAGVQTLRNFFFHELPLALRASAFSIAGAVLMLAPLRAVAADAAPAPDSQAKMKWKVTGELEEACSCRAACPCWFKSLPSRMTCDGAQIIFITKGRYGKIPLEGLALAQFVQSPEHQSMFESFGKWNFDYVYLDDKANEQQRQALKDLAQHLFPPAARAREYRFVPITRKIEGGEHVTTVGNYAYCSGHLIDGGYGGGVGGGERGRTSGSTGDCGVFWRAS